MPEDGPDDGIDLSTVDAEEVEAATRRVIARLLELLSTLDAEERSVLAALVAPVVELAGDDVAGFEAADPTVPPVAEAVRTTGLRVIDDDATSVTAPDPPTP